MIADARGHFFSPTVPNRMSAAANTGGGNKIKEEKNSKNNNHKKSNKTKPAVKITNISKLFTTAKHDN